MIKVKIFALFLGLFLFSGCETLKEVANTVLAEPTLEEIGRGLKEALSNGIVKGARTLSESDGYYKSAY